MTDDAGTAAEGSGEGGDAGEDAAQAASGDQGGAEPIWREDWREQMAGDDDKALKRLGRFKSPGDVFKSFREIEGKMSQIKPAPSLPEEPTDDDIAAYRKEIGVPETAEGYLEHLPDGIVIGDDDKPIIDGFLKTMHGKHATPGVVGDMIGWYYGEVQQRQDALAQEDARFQQETDDELRGEWGREFRMNMNAIEGFFETAPGDLAKNLRGARLADGSPLMANPDALRFFANVATDINPAATVVPGAGQGTPKAVDDRLAEIRKVMRTDRARYNRDEGMQKEYRDLLTAKDKMASRAA